jgi:hypothetical protein
MKISIALVLACATAALAIPFPPFQPNWHAPNFTGFIHFQNQRTSLDGAMFWQQDGQQGGFDRSAFIARDPDGMSTFMDWDGQTYGGGPSGVGPAIYYYDQHHCQYWCPLVTEKQCDEAESLCQYDMLYNATYQNSSQIDGTPVDLFTWSDYAFFGSAYNAFYLNHKDMTPNFRQNWFDFFSSPANSGLIQMTYGGFQYNLPKNNSWIYVPYTNYCPEGDSDTVCSDTMKGFSMKGKNLFRGQINKAVYGK